MSKSNSNEYNEIIEISEKQNFYFNDNDDIVIVFNKYDIGPSSLGIQEFIISKDLYSNYLNND